MAIYAVRREGETNERLIKRFKKQVQNARILQDLREKRYWAHSPKKRVIRKKALKRAMFREKRAREQFYA
ncbi:30S ribosomal protein S21 [Candidatus Peregrinibacteria bacterium]|nr:30S ribosomal protein S21 [Candidatus Peregrinibacteria bacterium]